MVKSLALPWSAFVAAFVYYVVLTLIVVGGAELSVGFVAISYLLPLAAYGAAALRLLIEGKQSFFAKKDQKTLVH